RDRLGGGVREVVRERDGVGVLGDRERDVAAVRAEIGGRLRAGERPGPVAVARDRRRRGCEHLRVAADRDGVARSVLRVHLRFAQRVGEGELERLLGDAAQELGEVCVGCGQGVGRGGVLGGRRLCAAAARGEQYRRTEQRARQRRLAHLFPSPCLNRAQIVRNRLTSPPPLQTPRYRKLYASSRAAMPASRNATSQSPLQAGSFSSMPWSATSTNAQSSSTPRASSASSTTPSRPSLSRTDAAAISECGPPSCIAESVSVKLHHMKRGAG